MKIHDRLKKLRHEKTLIIERLRQAEAKASTQKRRAETREKIIWGAAFLSLPAEERAAFSSILLDRMSERDKRFIAEQQANSQSAGDAPPSGLN